MTMSLQPEVRSEDMGLLPDVQILVDRDALPVWFSLLQQGFLVEARLGVSLKSILCDQIGLSPEYLEDRVQTIFMDGKAVDSLDKTLVEEGCVVALSAAMPGFVGAAFRKGGYYAVMRSSTTHHHAHGDHGERRGRFTLKLFNLLADELGEFFLTRGILLEIHSFADFVKRYPGPPSLGIREVGLDGAALDFSSALSGTHAHPATPNLEFLLSALLAAIHPHKIMRIKVTPAQATRTENDC